MDNIEELQFWVTIHQFLSKDYKLGLQQWLRYRPFLSNCRKWQPMTLFKHHYIVLKFLFFIMLSDTTILESIFSHPFYLVNVVSIADCIFFLFHLFFYCLAMPAWQIDSKMTLKVVLKSS